MEYRIPRKTPEGKGSPKHPTERGRPQNKNTDPDKRRRNNEEMEPDRKRSRTSIPPIAPSCSAAWLAPIDHYSPTRPTSSDGNRTEAEAKLSKSYHNEEADVNPLQKNPGKRIYDDNPSPKSSASKNDCLLELNAIGDPFDTASTPEKKDATENEYTQEKKEDLDKQLAVIQRQKEALQKLLDKRNKDEEKLAAAKLKDQEYIPTKIVKNQEEDLKITATANYKMENEDGSCNLCNDPDDINEDKIKHKQGHVSTKQLRHLAIVDDRGEHYCQTCKFKHDDRAPRLNVVIANSTLQDIVKQIRKGEHTGPHFDLTIIHHATLEEVKRALIAEYKHEDRPLDVLIVAPGIHDLINNKSANYVIEKINGIRAMVLDWNESNTFALGDLPFAPMMSKIYAITTLDLETHNPKNEKSNEIKKVNVEISRLNRLGNKLGQNTRRAPGLALCGLQFTHKPSYFPARPGKKIKKVIVPFKTLNGRFSRPPIGCAIKHNRKEWADSEQSVSPNAENKLTYYLAIMNYFNCLYNNDNIDSENELEDPEDMFKVNYHKNSVPEQQKSLRIEAWNEKNRNNPDSRGQQSRRKHDSGYASRPDSRNSDRQDSRPASRTESHADHRNTSNHGPDLKYNPEAAPKPTPRKVSAPGIAATTAATPDILNVNARKHNSSEQVKVDKQLPKKAVDKQAQPAKKSKKRNAPESSSDSDSSDNSSTTSSVNAKNKKKGLAMLEEFKREKAELKNKLKKAETCLIEKDKYIEELKQKISEQSKQLEAKTVQDNHFKNMIEANNALLEQKMKDHQEALLKNIQVAVPQNITPKRIIRTIDNSKNEQQQRSMNSNELMEAETRIVDDAAQDPTQEDDDMNDKQKLERSIRQLELKQQDLRDRIPKEDRNKRTSTWIQDLRTPINMEDRQRNQDAIIIRQQQQQLQQLLEQQQRFGHSSRMQPGQMNIRDRLYRINPDNRADFGQVSDELYNTINDNRDMRSYLDRQNSYYTSTPARPGSPGLRIPEDYMQPEHNNAGDFRQSQDRFIDPRTGRPSNDARTNLEDRNRYQR
jgi:hypothetical protein